MRGKILFLGLPKGQHSPPIQASQVHQDLSGSPTQLLGSQESRLEGNQVCQENRVDQVQQDIQTNQVHQVM